MIFVFLLWVVVPLFGQSRVEAAHEATAPPVPVHFAVDEYGGLVTYLASDGSYTVRSLADGEVLDEGDPMEPRPGVWSVTTEGDGVACGFPEGFIRAGTFGYVTSFPEPASLPDEIRELQPGERRPFEGGLIEATNEGGFRHQRFRLSLGEPMEVPGGAEIDRLDHVADGEGGSFGAWTRDGRLIVLEQVENTDFLTGETRVSLEEYDLGYRLEKGRTPPDHLRMAGGGGTLF